MPVSHGRRVQCLSSHIHAYQGRGVEHGLPHQSSRAAVLVGSKGWGTDKGLCLCKEQLCLVDRQRQLTDGLLLRKGRQSVLHAALEGSSSCKDKPQPCTNQPPEALRSREWLKPTPAASALCFSLAVPRKPSPFAQNIMLEADRRERVSSATEGSTFPAPQQ